MKKVKKTEAEPKKASGVCYPGLSTKKSLFVKHYLICGSAKKAARLAGYENPRAGHNLKKIPEVAAVIREEQLKRNERLELTADRVLQEIAAIAFANLADVVDWSSTGITLKNSKQLPLLVKKAVQEVSETVSGKSVTTRVKMHDKLGALDKLMKHLGLYPKEAPEDGKKADPLKMLFEAVLTSRERLGHDVPKSAELEETEDDEEDEDEDEDEDEEDEEDED